jgi:hypothetical protein
LIPHALPYASEPYRTHIGPLLTCVVTPGTQLHVSLAPQFTRCTVNCISRNFVSCLLTHLVVYIIARFSSLNTTTFCLTNVYTVLPHLTLDMIVSATRSLRNPLVAVLRKLELSGPETKRDYPPQNKTSKRKHTGRVQFALKRTKKSLSILAPKELHNQFAPILEKNVLNINNLRRGLQDSYLIVCYYISIYAGCHGNVP